MSAQDQVTKERTLYVIMSFSKGPDTLHQCGPYYTSFFDARNAIQNVANMDERAAAKLSIFAIAAQEIK